METHEIPKHVDDPPHVLLWSAEELAPVAMGLAIGMVIGQAFWLTLLGLLIAKVYRRFSDGHSDGYLLHMIYWFGFLQAGAKSVPNPYARRYLP